VKKKRQAGQPCCDGCPCLIAKDSLQGKVLSDTWTLESGSWNDVAVVDTYAQATGAVELWHVTPHPDSPYPSDVRLRVRGAADSVLRIILSANGGYGYEATQDALIVELKPGTDCGTLSLYQRTDGVEDLLATLTVYGAAVDEWHDLRGCYDPETEVFSGSILPHDETSWSQVSIDVDGHTDGAYAGFASGTADQSDFDTFVYRKLWYDKLITPLCTDLSITEIATRISIDGFSPPTTNIANLSILFYLENVNVGTFPYIIYSASTDAATFQSDMNTWLSANLPPVTCTVTGTVASGFLIAFSDTTNQYNRARALMNRADPLPTETLEDAWVNDDVRIIVTTEGQKLFRLSYDGEQTADLSTDATAGEIQTALEGLSTIGAGNVSVSGVAGDWQVEWTGTLLGTDVFPIVAITSIGDCLGEGYYYSETERVTCATCEPPNCDWASGHFDDADSICEWQVPEGETWTITPSEWTGFEVDGATTGTFNTLSTSESSSILLHSAARPLLQDEVHRVWTRFYSTGPSVLLIVTASDADNFVAVAVQPGTGTDNVCGDVSVIQRTAGVDSTIGGPWKIHYANCDLISGGTDPEDRWTRLLYLFAELDADGLLRVQIANNQDGEVMSTLIADRGNCYGPLWGYDSKQVPWARNWRVGASYVGRYAGVGTAGGSGEVHFTEWHAGYNDPAGCTWPYESCCHEQDLFMWEGTGAWHVDPWELISGTLPTRTYTLPASGPAWLQFSAAATLLHRNNFPAAFENAHKVEAGFTIARTDDSYVDSFGVVFGCSNDGTDYWYAEYTGDANTATIKLWHSGVLVDSQSTVPIDQVTITACVSDISIMVNFGGEGTTVRSVAASQSAGVRWGVKVTPQNTVSLTEIVASKTGYMLLYDPVFPTEEIACPGCNVECPYCLDGQMPELVIADVVGLESNFCNCVLISLAYELSAVGTCGWSYQGSALCGGISAQLFINVAIVKGVSWVYGTMYPRAPIPGFSPDPDKWYLAARIIYGPNLYPSSDDAIVNYFYAVELEGSGDDATLDCLNFDHVKLSFIGFDWPALAYPEFVPCGVGDIGSLTTASYIEVTSL
jgi:hypothetical protein